MIYELIAVALLALALAYVLRLIWLELRPAVIWDDSGLNIYDDEFDIEDYVPGGLDNIEIDGLEDQ